MKDDIVLSVVLYSYLDRPIFDVMLNGSGIGGANAYGGNGMITGIRVPFGKQGLTWRLGGPRGMVRNGETVAMKNSINLVAEQIPADAHYLAVNIYPDDTVEFVFDRYIPDRTPRGDQIIDRSERHGE
ncbi:hypothetical protein [Paraburkholderia strydomiana]|uniref:hypothetical protein n=1 Tax=Paraburkholderia strydomiana TaxID=1245417 RepID=UPI001BE67F55|nr:hypothetical protein [Paraburkholderia strydomiana]MBT2791055.1 hypothetical protein [Paraburkholderia strydomiana]